MNHLKQLNQASGAMLLAVIAAGLLSGCPQGDQETSTQTSETRTTTTTETSASPAGDDMIGKTSRQAFDRVNAEGSTAVAGLAPPAKTLSAGDKALLLEVAKGGTMQLAISKAVVDQVSHEDVKVLAQSEVEEQTGLSAKLKDFAASGGVQLPAAPDPKSEQWRRQLEGKSGQALDQLYLQQSGISGHEALEKTMSKVQAQAADPSLKKLAEVTLPVIRAHLQASREVFEELGPAPNGAATGDKAAPGSGASAAPGGGATAAPGSDAAGNMSASPDSH